MTPFARAQESADLFTRRPGILTITAGLLAAYGLGSMTAGVSNAGDQALIQNIIASQPGFVAWMLTRFGGHGLTVYATVQGLLMITTGVGVWLLKPWGRLLLYLVSFLGVVMEVQTVVAQWIALHHFSIFAPLMVFLFGWPLWYLSLPHVKELFAAPSAPSATQG